MTVLTTKDVKIAYATENVYGKLCSITGTIDQTGGDVGHYAGHVITVLYNGTTYTVTGSEVADTADAVKTMLNAAFLAATMDIAGSETLDNIIVASASGNLIIFKMRSGCVLTDGASTPLVSHLGIPAGNYPNRAFAGNAIITTVDISGGAAINAKTLTINGSTVTFDSSPANQAGMVTELNDAFTAAGVNTVIVASASGTQYLNLAIASNCAINAVAATTALALLGITAGCYAYWTPISVPNSVKLGMIEYERKRVHTAGQTANNTFTYTNGIKYKDFELKTYTQGVVWMTDIIAAAAGATPTSYTFHIEIPADLGTMIYNDICGACQSKYVLELKKDDCFETETFLWLNCATVSSAYTSLPAFPFTTAVKVYPNAYVAIDGDSIISVLDSATLTITNKLFDFIGAGTHRRTTPQLLTRDCELKVEAYDDLSNSLTLLSTLIMGTLTIICGFAAAARVQVTIMAPDESNKGEVPEQLDTIKHSITFKNSGDCAYSIV